MGRLNFNIVDGKATDVYNRQLFAGGPLQFDWQVNNLARRKIPHTIKTHGNLGIVNVNGFTYRYTLKVKLSKKTNETDEEFAKRKKQEQSTTIRVLHCCRAVLDDVKKFLKTNKPYEAVTKGEIVFISQAATSMFINSGGRDVDLVDIKCCYWTILKNFGIISEKTFNEYKDERDPRLISVGCLKRAEHIKQHDGEKVVSKINKSKYEWVWDFVVYKTYMAIKTVCDSIGWRVFSYITDGIYLPKEHTARAVEILTQLGFNVTVKNYTIIGYTGHWIILRNNITGKWKRANLGMSTGIKSALQSYTKQQFEANCDVNDIDNGFKTGNEAAIKQAEKEFERFADYGKLLKNT